MFQPEGNSVKSRVTRKHVIIGVTCAVVVAMVITGVLLGVRFYLDSANELVTVLFILIHWLHFINLYIGMF